VSEPTTPADSQEDEPIARPRADEMRGPAGRMGAGGMPAEKSMDFTGTTKRLLSRMRVERAGAITVVVAGVLSVTLAVIGPLVLGHATDIIVDGFTQSTGIDTAGLHRVLLGALALFVGASLLAWLQNYALAGVVQRTMFRLRADVEDKLNRMPLRYVDRQPRGDLLSRVTNDIDNLAQSLQQTLSQLLTSTLTLVGVLVMMVLISPLLALVTVAIVPLSIFTMKGITKRSKAKFVDQWRHTGSLNAQVEEAFTGHALVKVFGRQAEVERRFSDENEKLFEASNAAQFISGIIQPAMMFFGNLNYVAIALIGGLRVSSGQMSIGDIQAFIQYSRQFTQPLTQLASMINVMQSGIASAERVFEMLDAPEESAPSDHAEGLEPPDDLEPRGRVEFDHVSFSYDPKKPLPKLGGQFRSATHALSADGVVRTCRGSTGSDRVC
jgi:ATP-binding cassette subfamily B protein